MITEDELEDRLRELSKEHDKIGGEVAHYLDDMEYKPSYAFSRMLEWIDMRHFDPRSNEAKALRTLAIDIGMYEQGEYDQGLGGDKLYAFKHDGEKYIHSEKLKNLVEERGEE